MPSCASRPAMISVTRASVASVRAPHHYPAPEESSSAFAILWTSDAHWAAVAAASPVRKRITGPALLESEVLL